MCYEFKTSIFVVGGDEGYLVQLPAAAFFQRLDVTSVEVIGVAVFVRWMYNISATHQKKSDTIGNLVV